MIESQARVVRTGQGCAWVEVRRQSACAACQVAGRCGTGTIATLLGKKGHCFEVQDDIGAKLGEQVVIGIPAGVLTQASFGAYLLPLICMLGGALLAEALGLDDAATALGGLLGLAAGLGLVGRLRRCSPQRYRPRLMRRSLNPDASKSVNCPGPES